MCLCVCVQIVRSTERNQAAASYFVGDLGNKQTLGESYIAAILERK